MLTRRHGHGSELIAHSWNVPVGGRNGKKHPAACAFIQLDDSLASEILLVLARGEPERQSRSRRVEAAVAIRLSQMASH
jgi:hypothetical protein